MTKQKHKGLTIAAIGSIPLILVLGNSTEISKTEGSSKPEFLSSKNININFCGFLAEIELNFDFVTGQINCLFSFSYPGALL